MPRTWLMQLVELVDLEAERVGDFFFARGAAQALLDLAVGTLELAALLTHAARHPVERAELVEDRALDPELRVGLELAVLLGVVLLDRVHQTDDARVVQVVEVDVGREPDGDAVHDVPDEWRVLENDLLLEVGRNLVVLFLRVAQQRLHRSSLASSALGGPSGPLPAGRLRDRLRAEEQGPCQGEHPARRETRLRSAAQGRRRVAEIP